MSSKAGKTIAPRRFRLPAPQGFDFERSVLGHGWFDLAPFRWEPHRGKLERGILLPGARPALLSLSRACRPGHGPAVAGGLTLSGLLRSGDIVSAKSQVTRMLRLDERFDEFYEACRRVAHPDLAWTARAGAGRLLRSPGVYEDLVKMLCTTNCTWSLTRVMVSQLVARLGRPAPGGHRTFPTPRKMAEVPESFYRDEVRAGYRAGALKRLAESVAGGKVDPESWTDPEMPAEEIRRQVTRIHGAGTYVADNMLKLLGRYDGLALDSWCRRKFSELYHRQRRVGDRRIARFYAPFGPWKGLALWCDLTRNWFDESNPLVENQEKFARINP